MLPHNANNTVYNVHRHDIHFNNEILTENNNHRHHHGESSRHGGDNIPPIIQQDLMSLNLSHKISPSNQTSLNKNNIDSLIQEEEYDGDNHGQYSGHGRNDSTTLSVKKKSLDLSSVDHSPGVCSKGKSEMLQTFSKHQ